MHEGGMFLVAARVYRGLEGTLLEGGQNGLDACLPATGFTIEQPRIVVAVNHKTAEAVVLDNGSGATKADIDKALRNLGKSQKAAGALGKYGVGVASPVTECDTYHFTSWARKDGKVRRWRFREDDIATQKKLDIPMEELDELPALPTWLEPHLTSEFSQEWRTVVHLNKLKRDRQSSAFAPEEFIIEVQSRFSIAMRKLGALVRVVYADRRGKVSVYDVNPLENVGKQIELGRYDSPETGVVEVDLRLAPEVGGRLTGIVVVMKTGDNTAVGISDFSRQALSPANKPSKDLREALAALRSRRFGGELRVEKLELDVQRGMFKPGDGILTKLYKFLEQWYREIGWFYVELDAEEARDKRWAAAAAAGQQGLSELLSQPQYAGLLDSLVGVLDQAPPHTADTVVNPRHSLGAETEEPGGNTGKEPQARKRRRGQRMPESPPDDLTEPKERSSGAGTQRRKRLALDIHTRPLRTSKFWQFEFPTADIPATLTINTGHAIWGQLDGPEGGRTARNRRWLEELVVWLGQHVLTFLAHYPEPDLFEAQRSVIDDLVALYADTLVQRDTRQRTDDNAPTTTRPTPNRPNQQDQ